MTSATIIFHVKRANLRLCTVHVGAETMVLPGIKVSSIVMPSGGTVRSSPPGTGGCNRKVSLMTPFRYGRSWISLHSVGEPAWYTGFNSSRSLSTSSGSQQR